MNVTIPRRLASKALLQGGAARHAVIPQPRFRLSHPALSSAFSAQRAILNKTSFSSKEPGRGRRSSNNPEYPASSFEALGISKNMKIGIIAILCVFGTMETWFYCQWAWRWWKGDGRTGSEGSE